MPSATARLSATAIAFAAAVLSVSACGGSADEEARKLAFGASVIPAPRAIRDDIVTDAQIRRAPRGSVARALLQHWADLQAGDLAAAARDFEPGLRQLIGAQLLVRGLAQQADDCRAARPRVLSTSVHGDRARIVYVPVGTRAGQETFTVWARDRGGRWRITHDGALDRPLGAAAKAVTQLAVAPLSQQSTPEARRAERAASELQGRYDAGR